MWPNGQNFGYYLGFSLVEPDPEPVPTTGWSAKLETKQLGSYGADVITKDDSSLPSLVMFGDSFMYGMRSVMAENFRRSVFVNPWLMMSHTGFAPGLSDFPAGIIERDKPDLVIYERWERSHLNVPTSGANTQPKGDLERHQIKR